MWRCHCGEINVETARHCRGCTGPRVTHAEELAAPPPKRRRVVGWTFLGLGGGDDDEVPRPGDPAPRLMTESELAGYYRDQRRRTLIQWSGWIALAFVAAGLLAWQIFRPPR